MGITDVESITTCATGDRRGDWPSIKLWQKRRRRWGGGYKVKTIHFIDLLCERELIYMYPYVFHASFRPKSV